MEGIECMWICPESTSTVVDLGASPGGWTSVARKYFGCRVIAVDRSNLEPVLMRDEMVIQGDAVASRWSSSGRAIQGVLCVSHD